MAQDSVFYNQHRWLAKLMQVHWKACQKPVKFAEQAAHLIVIIDRGWQRVLGCVLEGVESHLLGHGLC